MPVAGAKRIGSKMVEDQQHDAPEDWLEAFQAAAQRPLATRINYAFIRTHKPVLDDASYRAFDTMASYRHWCDTNLPDWLGYGRI